MVKKFVFISVIISLLTIPTSAFASSWTIYTNQSSFQRSTDKEDDFTSWCRRNGHSIEESDKIWQRWYCDWKWEDFCNWFKGYNTSDSRW